MHPANDNRRTFGFMPRGLSRLEAAYYVGVSTTLFDEMVRDGRAPSPRLINTRTVWDAREMDAAFDNLPRKHERSNANPWHAVN